MLFISLFIKMCFWLSTTELLDLRSLQGTLLSYGSWIYIYIIITTKVSSFNPHLCDEVCQWFVAGLWFSPVTLVSSINKNDCHDIIEILLKVALNTHKPACTLNTQIQIKLTNLF